PQRPAVLQLMSVAGVGVEPELLCALDEVPVVVLRRRRIGNCGCGCEGQCKPNFVHRSLPVEMDQLGINAPPPGDHSVSWLTWLPEYLALIDPAVRCAFPDSIEPVPR